MRRSLLGLTPFGLALFGFASALSSAQSPITITILHTNDLHAHVEAVNISKHPFGSYARQATLVNKYRKSDPNVLLLNAGDTFQGTLFFNVYEGLADLACLNAMGYQAGTIGNHEFDHGPQALSIYLKKANFPIVSANIDASADPFLKGLIKPSTILEVGGQKVGIVGATTPDTSNISSPGPTIKFDDVASTVQKSVDDLSAQGINKIIVLTHIGYNEDKQLATKLHNVAVIVGGHSHTPLGTPQIAGWPQPSGPYPTFVADSKGQKVVIVQDWEWGKALGRIQLDFDKDGKVVKVHDAAPIPVDETVAEDPTVASIVAALNKPIQALKSQVIGSAPNGVLKDPGTTGESLMSDVIADGMLAATAKQGAVAAFVNSGGVRGSLEPGKITYGEAISIQPFGNTLVLLDVTGDELKRSLEIGVSPKGGFLNPSHGTSYKADYSKPLGQRISDVVVDGKPLDLKQTYRITLLNFVSNGGDYHDVFKASTGRRVDTGLVDLDGLIDYVKAHNPLDPKPEGRVIVLR